MKSEQRRLHYFSRLNVGKQLRNLYVLAIILPILVIGSIVYTFSYRQLTQNYEHLTAMKGRQVQSVLVSSFLYLEDMYNTLVSDEELRMLLSEDYSCAKEVQQAISRYDGFEHLLNNTASLTQLQLYVDPSFLKSAKPYSYFSPLTESVKQTTWYQQASRTSGNFWHSSLREGKYGVSYWELNYYCHIPIPKTGSYAILVLTVSNDYLRNLIQKDTYNVYISVNSDPVFFSSDRSYGGKALPVSPKQISPKQTTGKLDLNGETAIGSTCSLTPYNTEDKINILVTSPNAMHDIHRLELIFFATLFFTIVLSGVIINLYARYFSDRIQTLRLAMHKVANNDYQIVHSIQGDDELTATFTDLVSMVDKLKQNEAEIYESRIKEQMLHNQQQQMELKLLANQINPHFLYNTLETIRMMAFSAGNREVATAIKLLGKSMRYVLNNTKTTATTLDKEIDYIRTYLSIQKIRFGDRLDYTIQIEDHLAMENYQILPFLIQPIVENAYSHGLRDADYNGHIIIRIVREGSDLLYAKIFDNGVGMDTETLQHVIGHLGTPQPEMDHGVGLSNIQNRVHLYYGACYGLHIQSKKDVGTLVTLTIPLINLREEEE